MSELNLNRKIFLEQEELSRFQNFLQQSTANKVTLGNTTSWGILKTDFSGNEEDFKVEAGTNSGTVKIANASFAVDKNELLISQPVLDNLEISNDSVWRWLRISHRYRRHEVGTVSIDINGNITGVGTSFFEVLRGQATDVPVNIKFLKSDLSSANNSGVYQPVDITDDQNAILTSNVSFQAESDLFYVVVGSTPIDEVVTSEQLEGLYKYDDCLLELVDEEILDTAPTTGFTQDETFYIARVQNTGTLLTIQDKRSEYWGFNIVGISDKLDSSKNLSDLTNKNIALTNLGAASQAELDDLDSRVTENEDDISETQLDVIDHETRLGILEDNGTWVDLILENGWTGTAKYRLNHGYLEIYHNVDHSAATNNQFTTIPTADSSNYTFVRSLGYNDTDGKSISFIASGTGALYIQNSLDAQIHTNHYKFIQAHP